MSALQKNSIGRRGRKDPAELWRQAEAAAKRRALEDKLAQHIHAWGLPTPEREYRFHSTRGWRFDFAFVGFMVAVEVEGITPTGGRHQQVAGFESDAEKYAEAAAAGWVVLRFTGRQVRSAYAVRMIEQVLQRRAL